MEVFDKDGNFAPSQRMSVIEAMRLRDPDIDRKLAEYDEQIAPNEPQF